MTRLAEAFRMTTGGITKLTKKLIQRGLVETYKSPENKKEIYFRLTNQGHGVYNIHCEFHNQFCQRDKGVFEKITEQEYANIFHFIEIYQEHLDCELDKAGLYIK